MKYLFSKDGNADVGPKALTHGVALQPIPRHPELVKSRDSPGYSTTLAVREEKGFVAVLCVVCMDS